MCSIVYPLTPEDGGICVSKEKRVQKERGDRMQDLNATNTPPPPPLRIKSGAIKCKSGAHSSSPACRGVCFKVEMRLMAHLAISPVANIKGEEKTAANFLL